MRHFILGAACIFACSRPAERERARSSEIVIVEADGDFGSQPVTTTSDPQTFTVRPSPPPNSLQFDVVRSIESSCPEFVVNAPDAAGAVVRRFCTAFMGGDKYGGGGEVTCISFGETSFPFEVRFAPTQQGATDDRCRIKVHLEGDNELVEIPVSGVGIPPPLSASIEPRTPIDFLSVNLNSKSGVRVVEVQNTGSSDLMVTASAQLASGVFEVSPPPASHVLPPNGSTTYQITCTPPTVTQFTGLLTIMTNDPDASDASVTIPFVCEGIDHPVKNTDAPFTATLVQENAAMPVVRLDNLTATQLTGVSVALRDELPGLTILQQPTTTIAPLGATTVVLLWNPPEPYNGPLGGGLVLTVDDEADRLISIGMGQARIADAKSSIAATDQLDFKRLCIGDSKVLSFTMVPGGDDDTVFADYNVTGASALTESPFSAQVVGAPAVVEVKSPPTVATVEVTAMPMFSDGLFEGTIRVTTDSPSEPTLDVFTRLQVVQGGTTVDPPLLNFREVVVTGFSDTKPTTFSNCTADTIEVTGIALDGASAADFEIIQITPDGVEQLPPFSLARGKEVVIVVQMLPRSDGTKEAQVKVDYQEPGKPETSSETVALLGQGFVRTPDRDSYYRCSVGAPLQLAPLGFVVGFLVLRRRRLAPRALARLAARWRR